MVMDLTTDVSCPFGAGVKLVMTTDQDMMLYGVCMLATAAGADQTLLQAGGCPQPQSCRFATGKEELLSEELEDEEEWDEY